MALMMSVKTIISTSVAIIATGAMFACVAPFASADSAQTSAVVSSRSFPKASSVKKNLFAESTSTSVDENSKWGGIETLDVPQTESQGEKEAAAAEDEAKEEAEAGGNIFSRFIKLLQPSPLLLRQPAALNSVRRFHRLTWVK